MNELATMPAIDVSVHKEQINAIQRVMREVMIKGTHYGPVPGCGDKPVLLKPGAEKIMATFGIRPEVHVEEIPELDGHRRYRVKVVAQSQSGAFLGEGIGEGSTAEDKYAWEKAASEQHYKETPEHMRRIKWRRGKNPHQEHQVRTNPSDKANTVLKMAKKRALVDMVLTVTAASDIFEQDLDEEHLRPSDMQDAPEPIQEPQRKAKAQDAEQSIRCKIELVHVKEGETKGKAWTKYSIKVGDDWYTTFDTTLAEQAKTAWNSGEEVELRYVAEERGNKLTAVLGIDESGEAIPF